LKDSKSKTAENSKNSPISEVRNQLKLASSKKNSHSRHMGSEREKNNIVSPKTFFYLSSKSNIRAPQKTTKPEIF